MWRIEKPDAIGWQRGTDRFIVINKAESPYDIGDLPTTLQEGEYKEVRTEWPMHVQPGGTIQTLERPATQRRNVRPHAVVEDTLVAEVRDRGT